MSYFQRKNFFKLKKIANQIQHFEEKISQVLQVVDQKFGKLKDTLCNIIDDECKKAKNHVEEKFSTDKNNELIMKIVDDQNFLSELIPKLRPK